jgi:ATP-dependent Zn protease
MSSFKVINSEKNDFISNNQTSTEQANWCGRTFNFGTVSCLIGIILIIVGIAMLVLKAYLNVDLLYAGVSAALPGTMMFTIGSLMHCLLIKDAASTNKATKNKEIHPVQPTKECALLSDEIDTRAFFESKGIFGLPQELIDELTIWRRYRASENWDIELDAGFILHGAPGTGKTAISKCVAELLGGTYYERKCSDLMSQHVGGTEDNISALFNIPKDEFRVITIDEISGFLQKRRGTLYSLWQDGFTNHFLANVQGMGQTKPNFIVIGTTNEFDALDPALVRTGRLGQHYKIENPNKEARQQIFHYHLTKLQTDLLNNVESFADATEGFSGAEIVIGVVGAAKKAALLAKRPVQVNDFLNKIAAIKADADKAKANSDN